MELGLFAAAIIGWLCGQLVNYLGDVLPGTRRLSAAVCPDCGTQYGLLSYLLMRKCSNCGQARGLRSWIVQAAAVAASVYTWLRPHRMGYALGMVLIIYFLVVIVIDLEHRLILHPTSAVGAVLALSIGIWHQAMIMPLNQAVTTSLLGGVGGLAIMLVLYGMGVLFSKFRARRIRAAGQQADEEEALGAGDVILAGILGLVLGWPMIWFALLLGILLGGVVGVLLFGNMLLQGRYGRQALMVFMPYGPYFVLSAFFILFLPNWIVAVNVMGR